jgi:hypothetical protein
MQKTLVLAGVLLLVGAFLIALTPVAVSGPADGLTISMDRYVNFSNGLTVHLTYVALSNVTYGGAYSPDPANTTWPILGFEYQNHGNQQVACRFHVQISDDTGTVPAKWKYDNTDNIIYQPLYPGQTSPAVTLEFSMPNDRTLTNLSVIDDGLKEVVEVIPIVYPATSDPGVEPSGSTGENWDSLRNLMLIPILLGLVGLVGWFMARKRLF